MISYSVGLYLWNSFLRNVITIYFEGTNIGKVIIFKEDTIYTKEVVDKLKTIDIFITEAFNPFKIDDAEGFRTALKLLELGFKIKPLIVFRTIDKEFLKNPFILDYGTIYKLPQKMNMLMTINKIDLSQFTPFIERYPVLIKMPIHN